MSRDGEPLARLRANVERVYIGRPEVTEHVLVALLAEGHLLIEDCPGVGKTTLARALARSLDCSFRRIQFTPDLLPNDLLGVSVYHQESAEFVFKPGPLFANVVLADEINRTNPRTQSALLEAMSDAQVSVDGTTRALPRPFCVLATQNPFEFEGTYPLPESQLDRFLLRIELGYPSPEDERSVLRAQETVHPLEALEPVLAADAVLALQRRTREVRCDDSVLDYIVALAAATRASARLSLGVSPRGSLALRRAAQARALLQQRDYVLPDDVKALAVPVLAHRVVLRGGGRERLAATEIVVELLEHVEAPL